MQHKMITGAEIQPGDRVQLESGEWVSVIATTEAIRPGETLIEWKREPGKGSGGFAVKSGEQVAVEKPKAGKVA
ncbi:MAG: hypothetical protein WA417_08040 [Stellaceae bacterium]|jgi:hypothetical protein